MDKFKNSRRLVWFNNVVVAAICAASLFVLKEDSVPILTLTLPAMLALVGGWSHVVNRNGTSG